MELRTSQARYLSKYYLFFCVGPTGTKPQQTEIDIGGNYSDTGDKLSPVWMFCAI